MRRALLGVVLVLAAAQPAWAAWGWLGVRIRELSEQEMEDISRRYGLREGFGAVITEVMKDTPAEKAGLKNGDLVVAVRERPVVDTRTLQRLVAATPAGETLALTILRPGEGRERVSVRVAAMPDAVVADRIAMEFGFVVRDPEGQPELGGARPPGTPPSVAAIVPRSAAEAAGLEVGDLLVEVDGRPVPTLGEMREALRAVSLERPLRVVVRRDSERVALTLRAAQPPRH